ncbi:manganese catalase family protein [Guptibacillus algicola]|uniref:manganese catalase family protein n=1 Tax=Guptibacillus algicola TaxID=225844 RepID=UPI001CD4EAAB|nr:manganese catalase family protein [Alkalihalobacillus algicola]MCA0986506.1 manganese catalase family protein [Alkalihalobacillus algicola]
MHFLEQTETASFEVEEHQGDIVIPIDFQRELEKHAMAYALYNFTRGEARIKSCKRLK